MSTPFTLNELRAASASRSNAAVNEVVTFSASEPRRMIFLCHSHKDREYAIGLKALLKSQGVTLYVDWLDEEMPASANRITADKLRKKIVDCELFLFLATPNSMTSRWCPWEIGIADGKKRNDQIVIVPTRDSAGAFYGNEYLQLYRKLEQEQVFEYGRMLTKPKIYTPNSSMGTPLV